MTVTVLFSNKGFHEFKCWEEFKDYPWRETSSINSIIIKWIFNIPVPQYDHPLKHTLMVKLSTTMKPEEMLSLILNGQIEDLASIETECYPVVARMEYIEPLLGEEILNIVSNWVEGQISADVKKIHS